MHSLWRDEAERMSLASGVLASSVTRQPLAGSIDVDVAIVGGGYTGLWTAYYLLQLAPQLKIAIVEARHVGFGGSGRNGGWCSAFLPMSPSEMTAEHGQDAMRFMQDAMFATVDEVGEVAARENIDCGFHKGGTITSASNEAHVERLKDYIGSWHKAGFGDGDLKWEAANELSSRIAVGKTLGGMYSPHCAAINPWQLVTGLACAIESRDVTIYENSPAKTIEPHLVTTTVGGSHRNRHLPGKRWRKRPTSSRGNLRGCGASGWMPGPTTFGCAEAPRRPCRTRLSHGG